VAAILGDSVDVVVEYYVHLDPSDLGAGISRSPAYLDSGDCPHSCPQVKPALAKTA